MGTGSWQSGRGHICTLEASFYSSLHTCLLSPRHWIIINALLKSWSEDFFKIDSNIKKSLPWVSEATSQLLKHAHVKVYLAISCKMNRSLLLSQLLASSFYIVTKTIRISAFAGTQQSKHGWGLLNTKCTFYCRMQRWCLSWRKRKEESWGTGGEENDFQ